MARIKSGLSVSGIKLESLMQGKNASLVTLGATGLSRVATGAATMQRAT